MGFGGGPPLYPGESPRCCLPPRFLSLRSSPRRAPLPADPSLPAAQHLGQPLPLLPSPLVQRYLEHLLLPPPPQLGYEEALLNPYSYHKVSNGGEPPSAKWKSRDGQGAAALPAPSFWWCWGAPGLGVPCHRVAGSLWGLTIVALFLLQFGYQDGAHQLPGGSARQSPETSSLLGRVPAQALFGAGPVPSYGGQPGTDGGHLFQDLGMLSLPREKAGRPDPAGTRLQHSLRLPSDYRDMEEREQPVPLAAQPPPAQTGTVPSSQAPALIPILSPQPRSSWLRLSLLFGFMPVASVSPRSGVPSPWSPCGCRAFGLMLRPLADAALKRLASLLSSYGLGLPELSPQQLSSLSTLLQLLQSSGERGAGTGQAGTGSGGCQHTLFRGRGCCLLGRVPQDLCLSPFQVLLAPKCLQQNGWLCSRVVLEEVPRRRWDGAGEGWRVAAPQGSPRGSQPVPFPFSR